MQGKTIQIYLPDGNPRGVRLAEITSRTVLAVAIPRVHLDLAAQRNELSNVGIYFLLGTDEGRGQPLVYVGEAEDTLTRLRQHNRTKDFWNVAIAVVSKTRYFTKTHGKYLEWIAHEAVARAGRFALDNAAAPTAPFASESTRADLEDIFETIRILVAALGYPLFEDIRPASERDLLYCRGKGVEAKGEYTEDGFVVFEGSGAASGEVRSAAGTWVPRVRQLLIDDGVLKFNGARYTFTKDYLFASPSAAAVAVLGRNANGWLEWKLSDGTTLHDLRRSDPSDR